MLGENIYHGAAEPGWASTQGQMIGKLSELDRRAVDALLSGEGPSVEGDSPLARGAFMDHVSSARRVLDVIGQMPAEEPPMTLAETTLSKIAAFQAVGTQTNPSASANL